MEKIPAMHLKTNLANMGRTLEDLYNWIDEN